MGVGEVIKQDQKLSTWFIYNPLRKQVFRLCPSLFFIYNELPDISKFQYNFFNMGTKNLKTDNFFLIYTSSKKFGHDLYGISFNKDYHIVNKRMNIMRQFEFFLMMGTP